MRKPAVSHKAGDIVELAGIKFVVLENQGPCQSDGEYDRLLILTLESQGDAVFGNCNNYAESNLREKVDEWLYRLTETLSEDYGIETPAIYKRHIDLSTLDGYKGFGAMDVAAAPLTMDEAREYAEYIPNPDEACWLATGWGAPEHFGATLALGVNSNGVWSLSYCSGSYGVRPALVISSSLLSSVDDKDVLKEISTDELLAELRRRIEE